MNRTASEQEESQAAPLGVAAAGPTESGFEDSTVFKQSGNPMVLFDDELRLVEANDAAIDFLRTPREELLRRTVYDFSPEEAHPRLPELLQELLEAGHLEATWEALLPDDARVSFAFSAVANISPGRHLALAHSGWEVLGGEEIDTYGDGRSPNRLTPREQEVLQALAMGINGPKVGEQLGISYETVRVHTRNAMRKLGAKTQAHLIALALQHGLIGPPR